MQVTWQIRFEGFTNHTQSVVSHSHLNGLGEFHFPKSRENLRLVFSPATLVNTDVCTNLALYLCCSQRTRSDIHKGHKVPNNVLSSFVLYKG